MGGEVADTAAGTAGGLSFGSMLGIAGGGFSFADYASKHPDFIKAHPGLMGVLDPLGLSAMVSGKGGISGSAVASGASAVASGGLSGLEKLAHGIAAAEGFGVKGAMPTRQHNPGDLRTGANGAIGTYGTDAEGMQALLHQLQIDSSGRSHIYSASDTLESFSKKYTKTDQAAWLATVLKSTGYSKDTKLSDIASGEADKISVVVNVNQTSATPAQIQHAVTSGVRDAHQKQSQRVIAEAQGPFAGGY